MDKTNAIKLKVDCLLKEYSECSECFRHTYATIWQSSILFATFSAAVFGFFFSFQTQLNLFLPYLPFFSMVSILIWWGLVFEPMNRYGDRRAKRCGAIETELGTIIPDLNMEHYLKYESSKHKYSRVRTGVRLLALAVILIMLLLAISMLL
jgi:hypothetical protein